MVEYSREQATASDLSSGYSDEGYSAVFKDPNDSYDEMTKVGITADSSDKMKSNIIKQQAPNPKLLREKRLKILFLQYINKYLRNPKKYIDHPKQIKRLPSWFDDAIILFKENELSRLQKKMIREFFYGLVQYRDNMMISEKYGSTNTEEVNRQLGMRSPYSETGGLIPDEQQFPRERELKDVDIRSLIRDTREMDINRSSQDNPYEEYGGINPYSPPIRITTSNKNRATFGPLGLMRTNPSNSTVDDYVSFNKREQVIPGDTQSNPVQRQVQTNMSPVANIMKSTKAEGVATAKVANIRGGATTGSGKGVGSGAFSAGKGMLGNMFGNMTKGMMLNSLGMPQPKVIPTPTIVNQPQAAVDRRKKKQKVKMIRIKKKTKPMIIEKRSSDTISAVLKNIKQMNTKNKVGKPIRSINMKKTTNGLQTIRNMDKLFGQIKNVSSETFGKQNMKMKVVTDIKDQCNRAFDKNKFRQESMKMKNNYFSDVKAAYPQMRLDIDEMGDIKENRMMQRSMNDVPKIVNSRRTINSMTVQRGEMRPQAMGIVDYDFSIEPLGRRKSKKLELFDEDDFIERGR